jgi:hypothetical protein
MNCPATLTKFRECWSPGQTATTLAGCAQFINSINPSGIKASTHYFQFQRHSINSGANNRLELTAHLANFVSVRSSA